MGYAGCYPQVDHFMKTLDQKLRQIGKRIGDAWYGKACHM